MNITLKRYLYVVNGFIILLVLGIGYAWSVFVGPLENHYGWGRAQTSLAFTILMISFALGNLMTGILSRKIPHKRIVQISSVAMGGGMFLTSMVSSIQLLYFTYSIAVGLSIGMVYNAVVSITPRWFPEKQGTITGVLLMAYALSASILGPVCQFMLARIGVPFTFVTLAIIDFLVLFVGSFNLVAPTTKQKELLPQAAARKKNEGIKTEINHWQMLRSKEFYIYFILTVFFISIALSYLNHVVPALENDLLLSAETAALVVSAMSISNGLARPVFGVFYDKTGLTLSLTTLSFIYIFATWTTYFGLWSRTTSLMIIGACGVLFGFGGQGALMPTITRNLFGEKNFSMNFSIVSLVGIVGSVGPSIIGIIQAAHGNYQLAYLMLAIATVIPAILIQLLLFFIKRRK
ncbi:MAG: OFA family MFS transporter [Clostridia bacterium]|nr:OFA family MFS transporter [Clostridia bacterium]